MVSIDLLLQRETQLSARAQRAASAADNAAAVCRARRAAGVLTDADITAADNAAQRAATAAADLAAARRAVTNQWTRDINAARPERI